MKLILSTAFFVLISNAQLASAVEIRQHECVKAGINAIADLFTQYDQYSTMPGTDYTVGLAGANVSPIKMIKSQSKVISSSAQKTEAAVWVVLQPALVSDSKTYPRFLLNCKTNRKDEFTFIQVCNQQNEKQHYGLNQLRISVTASSTDTKCDLGESGIDIHITIEGNPAEIQEIKKATLAPAGILAPLISALFDEDTFFKNYFQNIYDKWIESL